MFVLILVAFMGMTVAIVVRLRRWHDLQVAQVEMNFFTANNGTGECDRTSTAQLTAHCNALEA